jgi:hypothetical protein
MVRSERVGQQQGRRAEIFIGVSPNRFGVSPKIALVDRSAISLRRIVFAVSWRKLDVSRPRSAVAIRLSAIFDPLTVLWIEAPLSRYLLTLNMDGIRFTDITRLDAREILWRPPNRVVGQIGSKSLDNVPNTLCGSMCAFRTFRQSKSLETLIPKTTKRVITR